MIVLWAGYAIDFYGYCLLKGYDVSFGQIVSPAHPYGSKKSETWPPKKLGNDVVLPGTKPQATATVSKLA